MGILLSILLTLQNSPQNRQPLAVRNVAMRVGDKLEKIYMHPATFVHVWFEMQFDLANINSKPVILKDVRVHYRIPAGWRVDATSPMSGSTDERRYVYSIELGYYRP